MRCFFDWFPTRADNRTRPWLLLGKGPSFSRLAEFDLRPYNLISINDTVREQSVLLSHVIDLDVLDRAGEAITASAGYLVMPWVPHVDCGAGPATLRELAAQHPVLRELDSRDRLLWYNLSSASQRREGASPIIPVAFFSAEACIGLLAAAGARRVRSLGVDGGTRYSPEFADLSDSTRLANRRESFDCQFDVIAQLLLATGIDYAPLDVESPVRVFVGAQEAQRVPVKVLEYSIRKFSSMSVEVTPLDEVGIAVPEPTDRANRPRTPFSFQRFLIPEACDYSGRAIYLDSDMLVFDDVRKLWSVPFRGAQLQAVPAREGSSRPSQFSVMLLDCSRLDWKISELVASLDAGRIDYENLVARMSMVPQLGLDVDPGWNSLEAFEEVDTSLLHYTDMRTQPWVFRPHALGWLWGQALLEAVDAGFVSLDLLREHAQRGFLRPSLVFQVEHGIADANRLPLRARLLDRGFTAPWEAIPGVKRRSRGGVRQELGAYLRAQLDPGLRRRQRRWARHRGGVLHYTRPFRAALAALPEASSSAKRSSPPRRGWKT